MGTARRGHGGAGGGRSGRGGRGHWTAGGGAVGVRWQAEAGHPQASAAHCTRFHPPSIQQGSAANPSPMDRKQGPQMAMLLPHKLHDTETFCIAMKRHVGRLADDAGQCIASQNLHHWR